MPSSYSNTYSLCIVGLFGGRSSPTDKWVFTLARRSGWRPQRPTWSRGQSRRRCCCRSSRCALPIRSVLRVAASRRAHWWDTWLRRTSTWTTRARCRATSSTSTCAPRTCQTTRSRSVSVPDRVRLWATVGPWNSLRAGPLPAARSRQRRHHQLLMPALCSLLFSHADASTCAARCAGGVPGKGGPHPAQVAQVCTPVVSNNHLWNDRLSNSDCILRAEAWSGSRCSTATTRTTARAPAWLSLSSSLVSAVVSPQYLVTLHRATQTASCRWTSSGSAWPTWASTRACAGRTSRRRSARSTPTATDASTSRSTLSGSPTRTYERWARAAHTRACPLALRRRRHQLHSVSYTMHTILLHSTYVFRIRLKITPHTQLFAFLAALHRLQSTKNSRDQ